jgi:hypothetical protein
MLINPNKTTARGARLVPLARLEAAVGVDPELLAVAAQQVDVQERLDLALDEVHPAQRTKCPVSPQAHPVTATINS